MTTKIPVGTPYFQDHGFGRWPEEWADVEFSITRSGDSLKLVAPGFGELGGDYGNGAIWVQGADWLRAHPMSGPTAPKLPEGLEPVALHPDLEALMPEPVKLEVDCDDCGGTGQTGEPRYMGDFQPPESSRCDSCNGSGKWTIDHHSADQVRAAILGATERAAKLAAELAYDAAIKCANGREVDFEQEVGDAIRGDGGAHD